MQRRAILVGLLLGVAAMAVDQDFVLPLRLTNAHITALFFGCRENATDGFDRNFDDPAPPPGMQTGYVGFVGALKNSLMRKDIRAHGDLKEWKLSIRTYEGKPFRMSWPKEQLPKYYRLSLVTADQEIDMATTDHYRTEESQMIAFVAILDTKKLAKDIAAEKAKEAAAEELAKTEPEKPTPAPVAAPEEPEPEEPVGPSPEAKGVTGGMTMLITAMGALLLLVVIFAAVRR
jgi:hypothetical protein